MTAPQQTPGGKREDTALAAGAAVGAIMGAATTAMLALLVPALLRALAGGNRNTIGRRLHAEAAALLDVALEHADTLLDHAEHSIVEQATADLDSAIPARRAPTLATGRAPLALSAAPNLATVAESIHAAGLNALREEDDVFRQAAEAATANHSTGTQSAQKILDDLAERGLSVFGDKRGREWDLASYCEMATRTAASRLSLLTQLHLMGPRGMDLVVVDAPSGEPGCRRCAPFEGRVLSLSGSTMTGALVSATDAAGRRKTANVAASLAEAVAAGLLHPNCRHGLTPFTDGAASLPLAGGPRGFVRHGHPIYRAMLPGKDSASYRNQQKQRALAREVRQAATAKSLALTPLAKAQANRRLTGARMALNRHVEDYHLGRQQHREHPTKAR